MTHTTPARSSTNPGDPGHRRRTTGAILALALGLLLVVAGTALAAPSSVTAVVLGGSITQNSARLDGNVGSGSPPVHAHFEYGTTDSLGTSTPDTTLSAGGSG